MNRSASNASISASWSSRTTTTPGRRGGGVVSLGTSSMGSSSATSTIVRHRARKGESPVSSPGMSALARIIDANANRAREALRVMEDAARFGLDDASLVEGLKAIRHALMAALHDLPIDRAALLAARDTEHDIGRDIKTQTE